MKANHHLVYLLLGANLGEPERQLRQAKDLINREVCKIRRASSVYSSPSWGGVGEQPDYLNQVLELYSDADPLELLDKVQAIETKLGRVRTVKWGARVIDIDILFIGDQVIDLHGLKVPHPLIQERNFAMIPMLELDENWRHPIYDLTIRQLYDHSQDTSQVKLCERTVSF